MEATRQNFTNAYDHLLKILLVGDAKSNKRVLLGTYLEEAEIDQKSLTTLGMEEVRGGHQGHHHPTIIIMGH